MFYIFLISDKLKFYIFNSEIIKKIYWISRVPFQVPVPSYWIGTSVPLKNKEGSEN